MDFYDLCLRSAEPEVLQRAALLGFAGVGVVQKQASRVPLQGAASGIELDRHVRAAAPQLRRRVELIVSHGREAAETPEVDAIWAEPSLDYVAIRIAKNNSVAVAFDFSQLLHASKQGRGDVLAGFLAVARLVRKYRAPFLLTSGAHSAWDVRSPSDLIAFGKVLGFDEQACVHALSGSILRENRKRLGGGWIMPGVELLSDQPLHTKNSTPPAAP